ncbi:MAG: Holliday junction branch migration DNA helicase RuvB [Flavobacteriales bacterium]|nr:Holliday junction branch migration DNA helicase RuvB [Flavobacteriales bacterium]
MSNTIRPTSFDEIMGQDEVVKRLRIMTNGCKNSGQVLPHVLIDGPPGLGKTTISSAIANEMGVNLYTVNAANVRSVKNLMPYLMGMEPRSVLFIDEIHRLPKLVEEFLYPVMEDFRIDMLVENKPESIDIPMFTMVGATTSGGSLSQPFYDRFTIKEHLSFYTPDVLAKLVGSNADKLGLNLTNEEMVEIAKRSKGTPRILNARLQWYKNYIDSYPEEKDIDTIFNSQGIDEHGFDCNDIKYINVLKNNRLNPLGLKSLSGMTGIAMETIENSIEPYMVRMGYVVRTQRGRILGKIN